MKAWKTGMEIVSYDVLKSHSEALRSNSSMLTEESWNMQTFHTVHFFIYAS